MSEPQSEPIARMVALMLRYLLNNYWLHMGVGHDEAKKLIDRIDAELGGTEEASHV